MAENPSNIPIMMRADKPGAVAKSKETQKYRGRECAHAAELCGFQFYAAAMEKESLAQGPRHCSLLKRIAEHRHGEDFNADIDNECSYNRRVCGVPGLGVRGLVGGRH